MCIDSCTNDRGLFEYDPDYDYNPNWSEDWFGYDGVDYEDF